MSGDVPVSDSSLVDADALLFSSDQLIELLNRIRGSAIPKTIKLSLRDLVLEYTQAKSADLKKDLEAELLDSLDDFPAEFDEYVQKLQTVVAVNTTSSAVRATAARPGASAAPSFSRSRPLPVFSGVVAPVAAVESVKVPVKVIPPTEPLPIESKEVESISAPVPNTPSFVPKTVAPIPETTSAAVPTSAEPASVSAAASTPVEAPSVSAAPAAAIAAEQPLDRIKAIKKAVNEKVGNPVNLIDTDNEIGREYMNALLDAMKKVNGGAPAELTSAMGRLEAAYRSVETVLASGPTPAAATAPKTEPVAVPKVVSAPAPTPVTPEAVPNIPAQPEPVAIKPNVPVAVPKPAPVASVAPQGLQSVAANETARIAAQPVPEPVPVAKTPMPGDEFMSEQVTRGLGQLLSEWKLFKSSGLFGTGPSGNEHPLYLTISSLPMSSVLSGRFEGSTQEIKQSIADYMNGWRYEQGMFHDINETFEHYLRRVIAAILEKQPATKPEATN